MKTLAINSYLSEKDSDNPLTNWLKKTYAIMVNYVFYYKNEVCAGKLLQLDFVEETINKKGESLSFCYR